MAIEDKPLNGYQTISHKEVLAQLDDSKLSGFHWKAMITSGMGFFTDAYDLFIIGVALAILKNIWHLDTFQISLVGSTSLIAAALGSFIFGRLADFIGRKTIYAATLVVLAIGALASAFSPNIVWLLVFRFILGLGIGGDYPLSATLMSEYANRADRGKLITMVFSMQGLGLILGPLVALLLLVMNIPQDLVWRVMLALGAVPALATFYMRRMISETPRFAIAMNGDIEGAANTVSKVSTIKAKSNGHSSLNSHVSQNDSNLLSSSPVVSNGMSDQTPKAASAQPKKKNWTFLLFRKPFLKWLIGTAGTWFLLDVAYYGTTISSPLVLKSVNPHSSLITDMLYTLLIFVVAAFPGYILAAFTIDKLGRRWIQLFGFAMMTLAYALLAFVPGLASMTVPFLLLYGVSYFFTEFGPNVTTFVYPAEVFPVMIRSTGHGLAAGLGKVGAFIGAFIFPYLLHSYNLPTAMEVAAVISLAGLVLTWVTLPETNQRTLEEISGEHDVLLEHANAEPVGSAS